jgi:arylsulfatase A-like enzyme
VNAASIFVVFVIGKTAVLWDRSIPWSGTAVAAYFWQDILVALVFAAVVWVAGKARAKPSIATPLYWMLAMYAAINIPVARVLSTPLTWPMLRATSGTLADSILLYATWTNTLLVLLTLATAFVMPRLVRQMPSQLGPPALSLALVVLAIGPSTAARVDTMGLHRNVAMALAASALPRIDPFDSHSLAQGGAHDWTTSTEDDAEGDDLSALRGIAAGRNVVLVSLESTGAQYLRLYGGAEDVTPNLDRLAASGVVFENAYAVYPESIKGLFSILCSRFPAFDTAAEIYAKTPCRSIAAVLGRAGYQTALFHSGRFGYLGMESIVEDRGYGTLEDAGAIGGHHQSSFGVDEPSTVARVLSWIDALPREQPFFVTYLPIAGHHPYETPEPGPFPTREEIGRYRNALRYGDAALGTLMAGLRARGLDERTVWVVLGDHGEALGQHQGNYGHTFFLYEENVRVPFVIAAPGATAGQRSRTMVSLVDTAPTILDLLGITSPITYQGRTALDGRPRMALFFTDYSLGLIGLRDGPWKFVHELESGRSKLFDLTRDPRETVNVAGDEPARAATYERTLRAWSAAQKSGIATHTKTNARGAGLQTRE